MALPSTSSSSSSLSYGFTYHLFLSFRGTDTRFGFTGNLYKALSDSGIHTFIDDRELRGGEEITPSLSKAIQESRVAIPVLSSNYASSSFCLDELVHIMECFNVEGRLVLPVFYDVDPSHVRRQTGSYGEAMDKHEARFQNNPDNMERLHKWKMALTQAANLSGHRFKHGNEYEHQFIGKIVEVVSNKINRLPLNVADHPVGLESRVQQVKSLLDVGCDDGVLTVGIYGMGGIGKTTLARATYNLIANQFEGLCFLPKVRENSAKHIQSILSKTVGLNIELGDFNEGIPIIKERLHRKKVLLILDDVDKLEQLQHLAGGLDWFGLGSRVIITTRDKHLLASHGIERTYEVDELNEEEALELLRWKAFKNNIVDSSYGDILNRAVTYASGLPLALEVVGSNLRGKSVEEWKSMLDMYERIPSKDIQKILKVSFDTLEEEEQKVFLDIACCFRGHKLAEVEDILHAHYGDCKMKHHIRVLVDKSLIKISHYGLYGDVTLHDLIEDMGKEIVRQESQEPGKRSRLWFYEDIVQVLEENKGTSLIQTIHLAGLAPLHETIEWRGDELKKMDSLKTLIIKTGCFAKDPEHLPRSLRVLEWLGYPSQDMPSDFCPKNLSICKLVGSCLASFELPTTLKKRRFENMRDLNLDYCQNLTQIPDVSCFPNLEKISFQHCENLIAIHESVGFLNKLKILNAWGCSNLRSFPPIKLASLQQLKLALCTSLQNFPEILVVMENITDIDLTGTSIQELPSSIEKLTRLRRLRLPGRGMPLSLPSSILLMPELTELIARCCPLLPKLNDKPSSMVSSNVQILNLSNSDLSDESLPTILTWFANVTDLDLCRNKFTILPECIKECRLLSWMDLSCNNHLQEIRGIPPNVIDLRLHCKNLREIRGITANVKNISAFRCEALTSSCRSMLLNQELHEAGGTDFYFPGITRIPRWFEHRSRGPSIYLWFRKKLPYMALFIVSESMCNPHESLYLVPNLIINGFKIDPNEPGRPLFPYNLMGPNHTFLFDMQLHQRLWENKSKLGVPLLRNEWNCMEVRLDVIGICEPGFSSIEMGIHIFKQKSSMENIRFTDPCKKRKLDDDDHNSSDQSQNHLLVKKHRFGDLEAFDATCAAATTYGTLLSEREGRSYQSEFYFILTAT